MCRSTWIILLIALPWSSPSAVAKTVIANGTLIDCDKLPPYIRVIDNVRAGLWRMACGLEPIPDVEMAPDYPVLPLQGGDDVNVISGQQSWPHVTQSESMVWANDRTIVVSYNDSQDAPRNYSGVSYSIDNGATFTRIIPSPFATGHDLNYGDPIVVYNAKLGTWFAGDLAQGCGVPGMFLTGIGIGGS